MFSLKNFILKALKGMVGNYPDFQVREYALNWYAKGVLTEADLAEVEEYLTREPEPEATGDTASDIQEPEPETEE